MELRTRVFVGLSCVALPLVGALAYNMGFVNSEDLHATVVDNYQGINAMVRERVAQCKRKAQEGKDASEAQQTDMQIFREEEALLRKENDLLQETNDRLVEVAEQCEGDLQRLAENGEADTVDRITQLEFENQELSFQLLDLNASKKERRKDLQTRIRALRLENAQMRADIDAWNAELAQEADRMKNMEKEMAHDRELDFGFGDRDVGEQQREFEGADKRHLWKQMDQRMWEETESLNKAGDADKWAQWDAKTARLMEMEDPDFIQWDTAN
eukprot:TRINITY_DN32158_c0_g1_i1.p2 TRINITY_DN32158_c0_g1~~TRINITY_DN32158_c0_g1_i1.p2  ORF type:complete len:271 (+),score=116.97 TRINITY_DN32158_c0_g1_i1:49-861(+)